MNISPILLNSSAELRTLNDQRRDLVINQNAELSNAKSIREQRQNALADTAVSNILEGKPFKDSATLEFEEIACLRRAELIQKAIEVLDKKIETARYAAGFKYCETLKPKEREVATRICNISLELNQAISEYTGIQQHLISEGIGLIGVGLLETEKVFWNPRSRYSDFAMFIKTAQKSGLVKSVPKELQ
jgi:hypothetical protein